MTRRASAAPAAERPSAGRRSAARPRSPAPPLDLFAATAPGLEPVAAAELQALGLAPRPETGGVAFTGTVDDACRANLWLRTASRVIARVGEFHARLFGELERRARQQPWERFLAPGRGVRLRVTAKKSRLYHTDAVAERLAGAIDARLGGAGEVSVAASDDDEAATAPLVIVRLFHDRCTLSVDTSGALLHQRGYRLETAKAPMRETLAAALLLAAEWRADTPLVDPMCGAGTIVVEAALMARRIAPGLVRVATGGRFAFEEWAELEPARWRAIVDDAREAALPACPAPIAGSDRDAGAIEAAAANAARAGVTADVDLQVTALSGIAPPATAGWLVTNPPYGVRVGELDRLRNLYAQLGKVARRSCPGWTLALLSADPQLDRHVGIPLHAALRTRNGGIPVRVMVGRVGTGD